MGKGECGKKEDTPCVGDLHFQVLEAESGKWLPAAIKDVKSLGCCQGKEYEVEYTPSGGQAVKQTMVVPRERLRQRQAAIPMGSDGYPDLDKDRGCTDILCNCVFLAFVVGWIVIGTVAFSKGKPARLLMPADFRDELCGDKPPRDAYPFWFVPKPEYKYTYGVCVKECPMIGDVVCNNDWIDMRGWTEARGWPPYNESNKIFEMNETEVAQVNEIIDTPKINLGSGATGTIAKVISRWPNIRLDAIDLLAIKSNCTRRDLYYGPNRLNTPEAILTRTGWSSGRPCNATERELLDRALRLEPRVRSFNCFLATYRTEDMVNRCIPKTDDEQGSNRSSELRALAESSAAGRYFSDGFGELKACWRVLLISAFTALAISFIALFLMRIFLRPLVYLTLLLILVVLIAAGVACHVYANNLEEVTLPGDTSHEDQVKTFRAFSYIFWGAAGVYFAVMLWLISRVRIAICVLEQASLALFSAPSVLIIPPIMFLMLVGWFVWFLFLAVYIQTVDDVTTADFKETFNNYTEPIPDFNITDVIPVPALLDDNSSHLEYENTTDGRAGEQEVDEDTIIRYMHAYNFFGFLWVANFLIAMAFFVISGVVIMWFWSASTVELVGGEKEKSTPPLAMKNAFCRMLRYHLGTLLFGSLLIAIIQFVRAVLLYIEQQLPEELKESAQFKIVKCLVHCFLAYLERVVKIINKNAYIICGIFGTNFCVSAKRAMGYLVANIARTAVLTSMGTVVMMLLKLFICGSNVYLAMLMIREKSLTDDEPIESGLFPLFFVLLLSFVISEIVMNCYDTCIDTVFMCSLVDEDRAGDEGDSYVSYVPPDLAELMDNFKDIHALEAEYKAKVRQATATDPNKKRSSKVKPSAPTETSES
eukprot:Sspe_Gene.63539::Locus_36528_Transcript_1_2_Confidence_0.667_Length_2853::g.63539::m.63539/K15377/SLC44A2_4_5; solute carrier family 44 (choline transporter-like protein), member 2/4/5